MKRIIVTPAGRERYISLLNQHLKKQRSSFDEWHLWLNTYNEQDITYLKTLDAKIIVPQNNRPEKGNLNIKKFFEIDSFDTNTMYLRLDDDIVWMEPNFIDKMFKYREYNQTNTIIYSNIINNSTCSYLHMRMCGGIGHEEAEGECFSPYFWRPDKIHPQLIHNNFIKHILNNGYTDFYFSNWLLKYKERVSVNSISWLGSDFQKFLGKIDHFDEEQFLSVILPERLQKRNMIYGSAICSHFAYYVQRDILDNTDILEKYQNLV